MPRLPRLHVPGGCYHVMLRGNHREPLFTTPADRDALNDIVADVIKRFGARVHCFCWMSNHIHLLIQIADRPLGNIMQRIAMRYSRLRHRQLRTTGHLFEKRYKAKLIDANDYLFALLRYIHLNPVHANMVTDPADYPWSSHRAYLGRESIAWLTTDFGLSLFGSTLEQARHAYATFLAQQLYASESQLLNETHPDDARVLGGDRFIASLPLPEFIPRSVTTLEQLSNTICNAHNVSLDLIRSSSRQRSLTIVRLTIAQHAINERIATSREVATFLNRDPSSLSELLTRYRS
jgi:putative transposase